MRSSDDLKTWKTMLEVGVSFFMCGKIQINQSLVVQYKQDNMAGKKTHIQNQNNIFEKPAYYVVG